MNPAPTNILHFEQALLADGWADNVLICVAQDGLIEDIKIDQTAKGLDAGVARFNGALLPGLANLHSHAHQRAMAGLAERAGATQNDSFWTWREVMYRHVQGIAPHHLHAIAAQLYVEMLKSGFTTVAEFQYLHHQPNGAVYDNPAEMSLQTLAAANTTGISITSLPVLYGFSGFGAQAPSSQQQRFINSPDAFLNIVAELQKHNGVNANTGIAAHSLRAVSKQSLTDVLDKSPLAKDAPIHIHIAEQIKEVEDCIAWSGARPVQWLMQNFAVDQNWCLVHATHLDDAETNSLAISQAVAGLCPTTEANLGDGFFNAKEFLAAGGRIGVGSDSHISVSPVEELRWLEYGQRLQAKSRNVLAQEANQSTGRCLFEAAAVGGAQAVGRKAGQIAVGNRADLIVLDTQQALLYGRRHDAIIDSWIFAGNTPLVRDVFVAGKQVICDGQHAEQASIELKFKSALDDLHAL